MSDAFDPATGRAFEYKTVRKFFLPRKDSTIVLLGDSMFETRMHAHFRDKLDYRKMECRVHEVFCTGYVSRSDCPWCTPSHSAKRIFRARETNVDLAFLARYAPELL